MLSEDASVALQDHLGGQAQPYKSLHPLPRRKVILLKPRQEGPCSPAHAGKKSSVVVRTDSSLSSILPFGFSPTSVLPLVKEQGAGNLFKALKEQAQKTATAAPGASSSAIKRQHLGSWADNQVIYHLQTHGIAVQPLPGGSESAASGPTVIQQQIKPKQPDAPVINKHSTLDAAWCWKFSRQWSKEQLKNHIPAHQYSNDDDDDEEEAGNDPWHDALHMIQAASNSPDAGVPVCDHDCYADPSPSPLLDSDDLDGLLEDEPSPVDKAVLGLTGNAVIFCQSSC